MQSKSQAKDIASLLSRAGLRGEGTYQDFPNKRHHATEVGSLQVPLNNAPDICGVEVSSVGTVTSPERPVPSLDRLLAASSPQRAQPRTVAKRIALLSLAGGVGKTTIATTLGRVLSGRNQRVVLANCDNSFGFQHLRGSDPQTMGAFTFIHVSENPSAHPLTLIEAGESTIAGQQENALKILQDPGLHADAILLDLPATQSAHMFELLCTADHILIPLSPDMHSAVTLRRLEEICGECAAKPGVHYILNRYDSSRSMHREMRDRLQATLGSALLPFSIREEPQIQDATRSGMTIIDYAPQTEVVTELQQLGNWAEQLPSHVVLLKGMAA